MPDSKTNSVPLLNRRDLFRSSTGGALAAAVSPLLGAGMIDPPSASQTAPWYRRLLVGMEIGPTGANDKDSIYMSRCTGAKMVENLLRAKAQYGVIFLKDQKFAYYNSQVAPKCPNLGGRNLLRECLDAARPHKLPIIAYCEIQYDTVAWAAHPDWRMKDEKGREIHNRVCYNSGYLDYIKQIVAEMMRYEVSGFHFDMLDFGFTAPYGCWCEHCQRKFHDTYGTAMPAGITWDEAWEKMLQFRCDSNAQFCRQVADFVHAKRPDVAVDFNYHGYPPFNWVVGQQPVQHANNGDFVTAEGLPSRHGHNMPSLLSLFMAGARLGGPLQVATSLGVYNYHDFTIRPVADMKWEVLTYLAHGVECTVVDKMYYDGSLEPLSYGRLGEVFGEAIRKREYFGHPATPEVGLYYSTRSRDWYAREDSTKYMTAFFGAHKALVQAHIPMGVIVQENVSLERLREFPVVYLPNAAILSEQEGELFERYVSGGGNLVVTGLTGLYDAYGKPRRESPLSGLLGARVVEAQTEHPDNYVRFPHSLAQGSDRFVLRDIPPDWPLLVWGPAVIAESAGARRCGELMFAYRSKDNPWSRHMSPEKVVGPAMLINQHGSGKTVYLPCVPDAAFITNYRMPEHRNLLRNVIRYLNPNPEVRIEAPANVETVVMRDRRRNRVLIHALCFSAPATSSAAAFSKGDLVLPPMMEEPAQYEVRVTVNRPFGKATTASPQARISTSGRQITVSTASIHEVVIIEG